MTDLNRAHYNILGILWKVKEIPEGDPRIDDAFGKCDWANLTIWINANKSYQERLDTLVHETTHAIIGGRRSVDLTIEDDMRTYISNLIDTLVRNHIELSE